MRIDLHTHSTASDGTDSPADLIRGAARAELDVIAITDHDTTAGWAEAVRTAEHEHTGMVIVPGAEFSCVHTTGEGRRISMHVLGYLFDPDHTELRAARLALRDSRRARARLIVERMQDDGYPISWAAVTAIAGDGSVGRPHIGRALVDAGAVPDLDTAFRDLLTSRQKYYIPKADLPVLDAIALIRAAGGLPVFAHPLARRRGPVVDAGVAAAMTDAGLVGIEVDHPDHDDQDRAEAAAWAQDLGLVPTGASDYHGRNKSAPLGARSTTPDALERLLALPAARAPIRT